MGVYEHWFHSKMDHDGIHDHIQVLHTFWNLYIVSAFALMYMEIIFHWNLSLKASNIYSRHISSKFACNNKDCLSLLNAVQEVHREERDEKKREKQKKRYNEWFNENKCKRDWKKMSVRKLGFACKFRINSDWFFFLKKIRICDVMVR